MILEPIEDSIVSSSMPFRFNRLQTKPAVAKERQGTQSIALKTKALILIYGGHINVVLVYTSLLEEVQNKVYGQSL